LSFLDSQQRKHELKAATSSFRRKRFSHFLRVLDSIDVRDRPIKILDVGGTQEYWTDKLEIMARPVEITLLNLEAAKIEQINFRSAAGDARSMPQFADGSFDVVHSNSVIEHVGRWTDMMAMANEIRRIASAYFVQTPYFWFPIEPHARTPLLHWLPETWRFRVVMAHKCGPFWSKAETVDQAMRTIQSSTLLDRAMFSALFPDAEIIPEKFMGLTKSLMALRKQQL
jgi:hypothetical protein